MRTFSSTILLHALVVLSLLQLTQGAVTAASCTNYTKGDFGPDNITSDEICELACQKAEGLPVGDFNSEEDYYKKCTCLNANIDYLGSNTETRDLCQDGAPSGAERIAVGMGLVLGTVTTLVAFMYL